VHVINLLLLFYFNLSNRFILVLKDRVDLHLNRNLNNSHFRIHFIRLNLLMTYRFISCYFWKPLFIQTEIDQLNFNWNLTNNKFILSAHFCLEILVDLWEWQSLTPAVLALFFNNDLNWYLKYWLYLNRYLYYLPFSKNGNLHNLFDLNGDLDYLSDVNRYLHELFNGLLNYYLYGNFHHLCPIVIFTGPLVRCHQSLLYRFNLSLNLHL